MTFEMMRSYLVVEETDVLLDEGDAKRLGSFEDWLVVLATDWGGNELGSGAGGAEDIVGEGTARSLLDFGDQTFQE